MKMNINKVVIINQSTGYLTVDIVNAYCKVYKDVTLITGRVEEYERKLSPNVKTYKIISYNKSSIFKRVLTWTIGFVQIFFILLFKFSNVLIVYVTNPPITYFASLLLNNQYIIIVYDIYPDALRNMKISSNTLIYKFWAKINVRLYKNAIRIFTLSGGMKELLKQYVDESLVRVIPNWSSTNSLAPILKKDNPFIQEHGLQGKFVIMYSGNIGYTHNVEIILELARKFKETKEIYFMIIGNGGKKSQLMDLANQYNLSNCTFLDWQPANKMKYSLCVADLSVVTLTDDTAFVSVPSKTYNILSVGSPLLCIAPKKSEIGLLVEKEHCGQCFEKDEVERMICYINRLVEDKEYKACLARNALNAASHYTYENANQYVVW
ncbi:glycosyltransferase family 4 protein [uncultured Bacteroides sp.]|uniref:glycosyltransferase family 4 protein n=2 Tax=uncultured Bacteroides sp. TaxID=162156 RepID=UPI0025CCC377|nr:glycosyltransferase family 4 protein [uncultured Bacteroides sp.]